MSVRCKISIYFCEDESVKVPKAFLYETGAYGGSLKFRSRYQAYNRLNRKQQLWCVCKARFRRRTFHEPNLVHWIKYKKSSASESIRNACFNLERLSCSFRLAWPRISPLERLWNGFDSDAELFLYRTQCINYYNLFCKQFNWNKNFSPFKLNSAAINSADLNNLGRPLFELGSARGKVGVWTGA